MSLLNAVVDMAVKFALKFWANQECDQQSNPYLSHLLLCADSTHSPIPSHKDTGVGTKQLKVALIRTKYIFPLV